MSPIAARFWAVRWLRAPRKDLAASVKLCSLVTCCDCCVMCHPCPCCVSHPQHRPCDAIPRCKCPTTPTPPECDSTVPTPSPTLCCVRLRVPDYSNTDNDDSVLHRRTQNAIRRFRPRSRVPGILLFSRSISILTEFSISLPLVNRNCRCSLLFPGSFCTLCVGDLSFCLVFVNVFAQTVRARVVLMCCIVLIPYS